MSATTIIVAVLERLVGDDTELNKLLADLKAELASDESALTDLTDRVTKLEELPAAAPPDLTALTDRLTAVEQRLSADDAAAAGLSAPGASGPSDPSTIVLRALSPATATADEAYSAFLTASGGVAPLSFSILNGSLPDGLSLSSGGQISGTPTTAGHFTVAIQAHDANGTAGQAVYDLTVNAAAAPEAAPAPADPAATETAPA